MFWICFAAFTTVSYGLRSPVLGAVNTLVALVATVVSVREAVKLDGAALALLSPRLGWLLLAGLVSTYVVLYNRGVFLSVGPLFSE